MRVGVYYVNGMMRDEKNVEDVRKTIGRITGANVDVQTNDSADTKRVVTAVALVILGAILVAHAIKQEAKGNGDKLSRVAGFVGALAIIKGLSDYNKIQDEKNAIAAALAGRVLKHLSENRSNKALLVLHSQGADVGYRALQSLSHHKDRIKVVTLGPMTTIPKNMGKMVTNFKFCNDHISRVVASPFETIRKCKDGQERDVTFLKGNGLLAHNADIYLKNSTVQNTLRNYA